MSSLDASLVSLSNHFQNPGVGSLKVVSSHIPVWLFETVKSEQG